MYVCVCVYALSIDHGLCLPESREMDQRASGGQWEPPPPPPSHLHTRARAYLVPDLLLGDYDVLLRVGDEHEGEPALLWVLDTKQVDESERVDEKVGD
jgi:hypothetical protein